MKKLWQDFVFCTTYNATLVSVFMRPIGWGDIESKKTANRSFWGLKHTTCDEGNFEKIFEEYTSMKHTARSGAVIKFS